VANKNLNEKKEACADFFAARRRDQKQAKPDTTVVYTKKKKKEWWTSLRFAKVRWEIPGTNCREEGVDCAKMSTRQKLFGVVKKKTPTPVSGSLRRGGDPDPGGGGGAEQLLSQKTGGNLKKIVERIKLGLTEGREGGKAATNRLKEWGAENKGQKKRASYSAIKEGGKK